jgi:membrane protein implicated in regulation of membrane protease activity
MMESLGNFLLETNPWWFVAIGLMLIIIDLAIISTEFLLFLGLSAILMLVPRLVTDNAVIVSWSLPVTLFISYAASEKFLKVLFRNSDKLEPGDNIIGRSGVITKLENKNLPLGKFYSYRTTIPHETEISEVSEISLRVTLSDGIVLPISNPAGLAADDQVTIIKYDGVNATVAKK